VEPEDAVWAEDVNSRASANVYANAAEKAKGNVLFREFVLQLQDNVDIPFVGNSTDDFSGSSVSYGINYKSEPLANRLEVLHKSAKASGKYNNYNITELTSNNISKGLTYPETPHLVAQKGTALRFRLVNSGGSGNGEIFNLNGHVWQEEPYQKGSTILGENKASQWFGYRDQLGSLNSFDILINSAGGQNQVAGDYLYNSSSSLSFTNGMWGILSVTNAGELIFVTGATNKNGFNINGKTTISPATGKFPEFITLVINGGQNRKVKVEADGSWKFASVNTIRFDDKLVFESASGGKLVTSLQSLANRKISAPVVLDDVAEGPVKINKNSVRMDNTRGIKEQSKRVEKKKN
jgi:hypothetical protein